MRFRTKILLIFILSILITILTTTSVVFYLFQQHNAFYANPRMEKALEEILQSFREQSPSPVSPRIIQNMAVINREYVQGKILKKDLILRGITSLFLFLSSQAVLLFILGFFVIRAMTSQLNLICIGLQEVSRKGHGFRFPLLRGKEFATIGGELNHMLEKLAAGEKIRQEQAKLAGWQEVSSFLSHQLKNPLTAISLAGKNIELCLHKEEGAGIIEENIRIISEESYRLNALIARLKQLSAFPELKLADADLTELLRDIALRFPPGQLIFRYEGPETLPLKLDRQLMEQVFLNLFTNSLEAANGKTEIAVTVTRLAGIWYIRLTDSVTGLPPDILTRIFTPKFTTKRNGMGLGLTFTRKILRLHGGTLMADLSPTAGLVFTLTLPEENADA